MYAEPFGDVIAPNKYQLLSNNVATIVSIPFVARKPYMTNIANLRNTASINF